MSFLVLFSSSRIGFQLLFSMRKGEDKKRKKRRKSSFFDALFQIFLFLFRIFLAPENAGLVRFIEKRLGKEKNAENDARAVV